MANAIDNPAHYGGRDNPYEAIKVIDAWGLGFALGNCVKYIARAGHKPADTATAQTMLDKEIEDLRKAMWYLNHRVDQLEKERASIPIASP